jgi:hypothetical protein
VVHADKLDDLATGPLRGVGRVVGTHRSHLVAVRSSRWVSEEGLRRGVGTEFDGALVSGSSSGWPSARRSSARGGLVEMMAVEGVGKGVERVEGRRCSGKARTVDRVRAGHGNRSVVVSPEDAIVRCVMATDPLRWMGTLNEHHDAASARRSASGRASDRTSVNSLYGRASSPSTDEPR